MHGHLGARYIKLPEMVGSGSVLQDVAGIKSKFAGGFQRFGGVVPGVASVAGSGSAADIPREAAGTPCLASARTGGCGAGIAARSRGTRGAVKRRNPYLQDHYQGAEGQKHIRMKGERPLEPLDEEGGNLGRGIGGELFTVEAANGLRTALVGETFLATFRLEESKG